MSHWNCILNDDRSSTAYWHTLRSREECDQVRFVQYSFQHVNDISHVFGVCFASIDFLLVHNFQVSTASGAVC